MTTLESIRITLVTNDEDTDAVAASLREDGATDVDIDRSGSQVFDVIVFGAIVVASMAVAAFVPWLIKRIKNIWEKGVLIRVPETGAVEVTEIDIPYGQVIVVGQDGTWYKYENVDPDVQLGGMVKELSAGLIPAGGEPTSEAETKAAATSEAGGSGEPKA